MEIWFFKDKSVAMTTEWGEITFFSAKCAGATVPPHAKEWSESPTSHHMQNINSKLNKNLSLRAKAKAVTLLISSKK